MSHDWLNVSWISLWWRIPIEIHDVQIS